MKKMHIKRVMYSSDNGTIVSEKIKDIYSEHISLGRRR
jgi:hypothetical protein